MRSLLVAVIILVCISECSYCTAYCITAKYTTTRCTAKGGVCKGADVLSQECRKHGGPGGTCPPRYFVEGAKGGTACYLEI